ncbi:MAG TPA: hypothetical protein VGK92_11735 [Gaiellales bacterium]
MSTPAGILFALLPLLFVVWIASSVIGYLRRNAEANERIATALEEANTLTRTRAKADPR